MNLVKEGLQLIQGIGDTLTHFKKIHKDLPNYKQSTLAKTCVHGFNETDAHNALHDVTTLAKLLQISNVEFFKSSTITFTSFCIKQDFILHHKPLLDSIKNKFRIGSTTYISNPIATKIADSGLGFRHLLLVYRRNGTDGIRMLLKEKNNGKPSVTSCKKTIEKICEYFELTSQNQGNEQ